MISIATDFFPLNTSHCTVATVEPMYEKPRPFFLRRDFSDEHPDSYFSLFAPWLSVAVGGLAAHRIPHGSTRMDLQPGRRQIRVPFLSFLGVVRGRAVTGSMTSEWTVPKELLQACII